MKAVIIVCSVFILVSGVKLPKNFLKCNRSDKNFKECVLKAAKHGLPQITKPYPELNVPSLNPFVLTELKLDAGSQGVVNVAQNFRNCSLFGVDKSYLETFEFDFKTKTLQMTADVPELSLFCTYKLNGKILLLPIAGEGPSTIVLKNIKIKLQLFYEESQKRSKTYLKFNDIKFEMSPGEVNFNFENLFNGDKTLGDNINKVLNENWKEVYADVEKGYREALGVIILQLVNSFFSKLSIEEAFD